MKKLATVLILLPLSSVVYLGVTGMTPTPASTDASAAYTDTVGETREHNQLTVTVASCAGAPVLNGFTCTNR
jgi:uncharacterized membrane protein